MGISQTNQLETIAARLAELGHPTRLAIFRHLVKAGTSGAPVGEIQQEVGIPASTLSHHISKMVKVGLIKQVRESRTLYCFPQFDSLIEVVNFLQEECCANECR
ncbi:ArsR/SmtB family transcription factor [Aliikangiella coralliicola]|uniref:Helix-turn-helix transcriptional regulator n=1 Tax=Aliikangiella coralliicola TaxID=2592383 RepID=A0A545UBJ0_9GAMM|nr:helix-turn-helix domain-containing protein [Aliikangiella coralliicola]TQV86836.1 helix-turn-helix transcriptional regulator [Aliikangiella coralliicola]